MAYIQGVDPNQRMMLPEYLDDYVTEDSAVRVIDAYVNTLDLEKMNFTKINKYGPGAPGYHPKVLLKLYIYGYMNSVRSSRKLERETHRNIEVLWLLRKLQPDFKTIADFRKENKEQIKGIFKDFTLLCKQLELFGEKLIAVDGTKIKASNSKKNNFNAKKIERQLKYIEEKTEKYMQALENSDSDEDVKGATDKSDIKEKLKLLEKRKYKYEELRKKLEESEDNEISSVDPDSRLMDNKNNGVDVSYNVQIAVDSKHKLIVDYEVTNNPADQGNLYNMAMRAKEVFQKEELEVVADKGYYQAEDLKKCEGNGIITYVTKQIYSNATGEREFYGDKFKYDKERDLYICPIGQELYRMKHRLENPKRIRYRNYEACKKCEYKSKCTKSSKGREINRAKDQDFLDIVDARTKTNMDKYLMRQMIVEHPFGTIKRAMNGGYFLTRGMKSVKVETSLMMLSYNLKRVINILGVSQFIRKIAQLRGYFSCRFEKYAIKLMFSHEILHIDLI